MLKKSDIVEVPITDEMLKEAEKRAKALRENNTFLKRMVELMGLEDKTVEEIIWGYV